ncbi:MAG: metallophosphoesterase [Candidatus Diapherotrites archaeon]
MAFASDAHSSTGKAESLGEKLLARGIGVLFYCGDFTNEGSTRLAGEILDAFKGLKVHAVPGNMDSKEIIELLEKRGESIHRKKIELGGYTFIGLGGAKPVHTFYRVNLGELEAKKCLEKLMDGADARKTVIVTHCPPSKCDGLSKTHSGIDLGLDALREMIGEKQPLLSVFCHVHESMGEAFIGKTKCVNTGALREGNAVIVDLLSLETEWLKV